MSKDLTKSEKEQAAMVEPIKESINKRTKKVTWYFHEVSATKMTALGKNLEKVTSLSTTTFDTWLEIGTTLSLIKEVYKGNTKVFGLFLTRAEERKVLPAINQNNRAYSMTLASWNADGFKGDKFIKKVPITLKAWRDKYAPHKSSPLTVYNAFCKWCRDESYMAKIEKKKKDKAPSAPAVNDVNQDLKQVSNQDLLESIGREFAEINERNNNSKITIAEIEAIIIMLEKNLANFHAIIDEEKELKAA